MATAWVVRTNIERMDAYYPCGFAANATDLFWQEYEQKPIYKAADRLAEPVSLCCLTSGVRGRC